MTIRNILLALLTLTVLAFCAFMAVEVIRIEAGVRQAANNVTTVAVKIDTGVDKVGAKIDGVVDHVDKAVEQAAVSLDKTVGTAANPFSAFFSKPAPTPSKKS